VALNCDHVKYANAADKGLKDGTCADQGFTVKGDAETKTTLSLETLSSPSTPNLHWLAPARYEIADATCGQSDLNCDYVKYAKAAEKPRFPSEG